jgi:hypothetical protein
VSGKTYVAAFQYVDSGALARVVTEQFTRKLRFGDVARSVGTGKDGWERDFWASVAKATVGIDVDSDVLFDDDTELDDPSSVEVEVKRIQIDPLGLSGDVYTYDLVVKIPPTARFEREDGADDGEACDDDCQRSYGPHAPPCRH